MKKELETHEHVRLIYKHLKWASEHAAKIYNLIKPEDKNEIIPDNQMTMFDEDIEDMKDITKTALIINEAELKK